MWTGWLIILGWSSKLILGYYLNEVSHFMVDSLINQNPGIVAEFQHRNRHDHVDSLQFDDYGICVLL